MPPSLSKDDDRLGDSAAGTAESPAAEKAGKKSPAAGASEWLYERPSTDFLSCFADIFCVFQISRPKTDPRVLQLLPKLNCLCRRCRGRRWRSQLSG